MAETKLTFSSNKETPKIHYEAGIVRFCIVSYFTPNYFTLSSTATMANFYTKIAFNTPSLASHKTWIQSCT